MMDAVAELDLLARLRKACSTLELASWGASAAYNPAGGGSQAARLGACPGGHDVDEASKRRGGALQLVGAACAHLYRLPADPAYYRREFELAQDFAEREAVVLDAEDAAELVLERPKR